MGLCKIRLCIPGKSLAIEMPREEAEVWFATLTDAMLNTQPEPDGENESSWDDDGDSCDTSGTEGEKGDFMGKTSKTGQVCKAGYKGFLMTKCEHCGTVKGWNAKDFTEVYKCRICGEETMLVDLHSMHARCICGKSWRYKTNLTDRLAEIDCIACGAPITMEQDKSGNYQSLHWESL